MAFNFVPPQSRMEDPRMRQVRLAVPDAPVDSTVQAQFPSPASGAYPNLIDTPGANTDRRVFEDFTDFIANRNDAGAGWTPLPTTNMSFDTVRDPETGEYISQTINPDYAGVPQVMQQMSGTFLEPLQSRLNFGIGDMNAKRAAAIAASPISEYQDSRITQSVDPQTGFRTYTQTPETKVVPFLPIGSRFL